MNNKLNNLAVTNAPVFLFVCVCVSLQLYFVYWDMSHCLRALTETLEERSFVANDIQVREFICHSVCSLPAPLSIFLVHSC